MSLASIIICDSCAISHSLLSTSTIDQLLAGFSQLFRLVLTRFEPRCITDIVGGATLERPSAKIRSRIFEDGPCAKIGSLENFRPYGNIIIVLIIAQSIVRDTKTGTLSNF